MPPTFPMLVGGRLRRADAGSGAPVRNAAGALVGHATVASRTDLADAVAAARTALPGWSGASADDRGRVLHDVAEALDERHDRFFAADVPAAEVGAAADRWLWYAGWTDKITDVLGAVHPVAGPYASWSAPRPVGVVGVLAPGSLLGLVDGLAAVLAVGATAVVLAPQERSPAVAVLAELLATSELPAGAANLLTGDVAGLAPDLARAGVDGLDLAGTPTDPGDEAADRGVRVLPAGPADPGLARLRAWTETATVWHSVGR